jgi:hypothetical protein
MFLNHGFYCRYRISSVLRPLLGRYFLGLRLWIKLARLSESPVEDSVCG